MELLSSNGDAFLVDVFLHDDAATESHLFSCLYMIARQYSDVYLAIIINNGSVAAILKHLNGIISLIP